MAIALFPLGLGASINKRLIQGIDIPKNNSSTRDEILRINHTQSIPDNADLYREVSQRRIDTQMVLNDMFDVNLMMTPETRTIRPVDNVGISTMYITQIIFPLNYKIVGTPLVSFATDVFSHENNLVKIKPKSNFFGGNMLVTLSDGKSNKAMTIVFEKHLKKDCFIREQSYICGKVQKNFDGSNEKDENQAYAYGSKLSLIYQYTNPKVMNDLEAMFTYEQLTGEPHFFAKDGDQVTFQSEGINYKIIRDDNYGTVMYRSVNIRVEAK